MILSNHSLTFFLSIHIPELLEDSCHEPVTDGVTFFVRYLGCCGVQRLLKIIIDFLSKCSKVKTIPRPSGEEVTAEAIKNIIQAVNFVFIKAK